MPSKFSLFVFPAFLFQFFLLVPVDFFVWFNSIFSSVGYSSFFFFFVSGPACFVPAFFSYSFLLLLFVLLCLYCLFLVPVFLRFCSNKILNILKLILKINGSEMFDTSEKIKHKGGEKQP